MTEQTFYRWRTEYGGFKIHQARRLKRLESENSRLKRSVADLTLDNQVLSEGVGGNPLCPSRRRQCVDHVKSGAPAGCWVILGPHIATRR